MKVLAVLLLGFQFAAPVKLADGFDPATTGLAWISSEHELLAWSAGGVKVFRYGVSAPIECGLGGLNDINSIAPGDANNDGRDDLAILTSVDAELWINRNGRFERLNIFVPEGAYNKAVWLDYDHDGLLDLFLLGDKSVLLRNDGAGFTNVTNNFPFVQGRAVDGEVRDSDLTVQYSDRPAVRYIDKLGGRYEADELPGGPAQAQKAKASIEADYDGDGRVDRFEIRQDGALMWIFYF